MRNYVALILCNGSICYGDFGTRETGSQSVKKKYKSLEVWAKRIIIFIRADVYWCFWTVVLEKTIEVLEKTIESPLVSKEIQPVHPKGNHSCIFIGRTNAEAETPKLRKLVMDRKAWHAAVYGVTKSRTRLSDRTELMFLEHLLHAKNYFKHMSHISPQILLHKSRCLIQVITK